MNYVPVILVKALTPLMLLSLVFAVTSLVTALTCKSRKWIPILCGVAFLALALIQLYLRTIQFYSVAGLMSPPDAFAEAVWRFIAVAIVTPFIAPLALCGIAIAAFKRVSVRVVLIAALWMMLITANVLATRHFDWKLSVSTADGRGDRDDKLWTVQRDAYVDTLKLSGVSVDPNEIEYNDLLLPSAVYEDIYRDDFFKEFPPPSMLKDLFKNTRSESYATYSATLDREVFEKNRDACKEEGIRLARERLKLERKD